MLFLAAAGYRCVAHDRRGHGRSSQPWNGNEMDTYADDLAELVETLDLTGAVLVGFSAGGGEVARYIGRHGTRRLAKAALISAVPPLMLKTADNPDDLPIATFDAIRRDSPRRRQRSLAALQGSGERAVLRCQPAGRQGLAGYDRRVLASGYAGRSPEYLRVYQGILRDGLHARPQAVRRAHADLACATLPLPIC
jgi:pimeloyl-ACP methyl ester carboxylesterase